MHFSICCFLCDIFGSTIKIQSDCLLCLKDLQGYDMLSNTIYTLHNMKQYTMIKMLWYSGIWLDRINKLKHNLQILQHDYWLTSYRLLEFVCGCLQLKCETSVQGLTFSKFLRFLCYFFSFTDKMQEVREMMLLASVFPMFPNHAYLIFFSPRPPCVPYPDVPPFICMHHLCWQQPVLACILFVFLLCFCFSPTDRTEKPEFPLCELIKCFWFWFTGLIVP